jgi:3-oxoacyl-[acyl-carrier protein] reductase
MTLNPPLKKAEYLFNLNDKVAIVTGASSGLGTRFAHILAAHGAKTVLVARRVELLIQHVAEIKNSGGRAMAVAADITKAEDIETMLDQVETTFGSPSILVNNAGIATSDRFLEISREAWSATLALNLEAVMFVAQAVAKRMIASQNHGSIINIASILGQNVKKAVAAYCTSKAGVIQLTRAMALELGNRGIRVNALAPGYAITDINREFLLSQTGQALLKDIPLGRFAEDGDFDGALLLLASDAGRYITGSVITADGGHLVGF